MNRFGTLFTALALSALVAGCGDSSKGSSSSGTASGQPSPTAPGAGTGEGGLGRGPAPVNLGTSGNYVILAKSGISTVPASAITGNMGLSPAAATSITGFNLSTPPTTFTTSAQDTGQVFAADYDAPTPSNLTTAVANMQTAYTDANGRAADYTELGAGNIGGMTLPPAVYKWGTGLLIPTTVVLSGGPNDVWIFQIAGGLTMASAKNVTLTGGALAKNVFWATFGAAQIGSTSHFEGILLSQTSINMDTGASTKGRLLAQTAVTLDQNVVTQP